MPDFVLFRVRNQPALTLSTLYTKWVLFLFALFMVGGNFFRLFPLTPYGNHLSILEVLLYGSVFPLYCLSFRKSALFLIAIALSTFYGMVLHGFDLMSFLYSCKLIAMIATGVVLGQLISMELLLRIFSYVLFVGLLLFFVFPRAELLFKYLEGYGVHFIGDPHQRRFISPFFDPNFYAAVACIPLILSHHLNKKPLFFLFLATIILTFSRSGIATCFFLLFCLLFARRGKINLSFAPFLMGVGVIVLALFYMADLGTLLDRTIHLFEDPSALARFDSLKTGFAYFLERPFFGVGYNYISYLFTDDLQNHVLDSSLLTTLINFGLIPTLVLFGVGVYWTIVHFRRGIFAWLYIYLLICILFTSQFNQLLYFPYWLIPMIALFTALVKENENRVCT